jgi:hypothetical protein
MTVGSSFYNTARQFLEIAGEFFDAVYLGIEPDEHNYKHFSQKLAKHSANALQVASHLVYAEKVAFLTVQGVVAVVGLIPNLDEATRIRIYFGAQVVAQGPLKWGLIISRIVLPWINRKVLKNKKLPLITPYQFGHTGAGIEGLEIANAAKDIPGIVSLLLNGIAPTRKHLALIYDINQKGQALLETPYANISLLVTCGLLAASKYVVVGLGNGKFVSLQLNPTGHQSSYVNVPGKTVNPSLWTRILRRASEASHLGLDALLKGTATYAAISNFVPEEASVYAPLIIGGASLAWLVPGVVSSLIHLHMNHQVNETVHPLKQKRLIPSLLVAGISSGFLAASQSSFSPLLTWDIIQDFSAFIRGNLPEPNSLYGSGWLMKTMTISYTAGIFGVAGIQSVRMILHQLQHMTTPGVKRTLVKELPFSRRKEACEQQRHGEPNKEETVPLFSVDGNFSPAHFKKIPPHEQREIVVNYDDDLTLPKKLSV